jgi:hypothetical protein
MTRQKFVVELFMRKIQMRTALIYAAILGGALMALALSSVSLSPMTQGTARVEVGKPAIVPVAGAERSELGRATSRLVITIQDFEAASGAPVVGVVSIDCQGVRREVGRFGPFPNRSILGDGRVKPQRFGFTVPDDPSCRPLRSVTITLEPQTDALGAASMNVLGAEIE